MASYQPVSVHIHWLGLAVNEWSTSYYSCHLPLLPPTTPTTYHSIPVIFAFFGRYLRVLPSALLHVSKQETSIPHHKTHTHQVEQTWSHRRLGWMTRLMVVVLFSALPWDPSSPSMPCHLKHIIKPCWLIICVPDWVGPCSFGGCHQQWRGQRAPWIGISSPCVCVCVCVFCIAWVKVHYQAYVVHVTIHGTRNWLTTHGACNRVNTQIQQRIYSKKMTQTISGTSSHCCTVVL